MRVHRVDVSVHNPHCFKVEPAYVLVAEFDVERLQARPQVLDAVRPDHRDRRERLGEHPRQRDRVGRAAGAAAELLGAGTALAVGRVLVDPRRVPVGPGEEPARLRGPREQRHPGAGMPRPLLGTGRGQAARPRRLVLDRERQVRAVAADAHDTTGGGVRVRLLDPRQRPVGHPEGADLTRTAVRVQRVDQLADLDGWVVAVEQVEIDRTAEPPDALAQIARDVRRRDADAVAVRMRALGHEHDLLAHAGTIAEPLPEQSLGVAALVHVRGVDHRPARLDPRIQHRVVAVARRRREAQRPQGEPGHGHVQRLERLESHRALHTRGLPAARARRAAGPTHPCG